MEDELSARKFILVIAVAACVPIFGATASYALTAGKAANTSLTMQSWPGHGFFGYVKSPSAQRCADQRLVVVFERFSTTPKDRRIGTTRARRQGDAYEWAFKTMGSGTFYARATRTAACNAARSQPVRSLLRSSVIPNCPSTADACKFDQLHVDTGFGTYCPPFGSAAGRCSAFTESGPIPWCCWRQDPIAWKEDKPGTSHRSFEVIAHNDQTYAETAFLVGFLPGPSSADFTITNAGAPVWTGHSDVRWRTPDLPGARPGEVGGPLYLNFVNGKYGADVYIHGYLFRK